MAYDQASIDLTYVDSPGGQETLVKDGTRNPGTDTLTKGKLPLDGLNSGTYVDELRPMGPAHSPNKALLALDALALGLVGEGVWMTRVFSGPGGSRVLPSKQGAGGGDGVWTVRESTCEGVWVGVAARVRVGGPGERIR